MNIKSKSLSFILAIMLLSSGCGSSNTSENNEFKDARDLVKSLGKYSASKRDTNTQQNSLGETEGFIVKDNDFSKPMTIDMKGNIKAGGVLVFTNKEGHKVEIESKQENVVLIKVDLNGDNKFSEDEVIVEKFEPIEVITPPGGDTNSIYGSDLQVKMDSATKDEKILVRIDLVEPNYIYPVEIQRVGNSTGGANVQGGSVTYFYNGKEVTKEEMDQIQKRYQENERKRNEYRAKINKENIEEFLLANHITENESIKNAIEAGFSHFELSLTTQEIKDLVDANEGWILAVTIPPTATDAIVE